MSSPASLPPEGQASIPSVAPEPQVPESPVKEIISCSPDSLTSSALISPVGLSTIDSAVTVASSASPESGSPIPGGFPTASPSIRPLGGTPNDPLHEPVRPKFVNPPGYVVPAPSFTYNVFPRANSNSASASPQQSSAIPALKFSPPLSAAALQPPVPGHSFGSRPSFSYNVVSHTNISLASGQQFQPATTSNHALSQGGKFAPPPTVASLQPPIMGQYPRPNSTATVAATRTSGASTTEAAIAAVASASSQSIQLSTNVSTSSSTPSPSSNLRPSMLIPTTPSFTARPPALGFSGIPGLPGIPNSASVPPNLVSVRVQAPHIQPQIFAPYPSRTPPPQALWSNPIQPGGLQHAPFVPYPGVFSAPLSFPMGGGLIHPSGSLPNVRPPGVPILIANEGTTGNPGMSTPSPDIDNNKQANDSQKDGGVKKPDVADAWTAHKTESGAIYYYNSITGESTYEKPSSFKIEPEKNTVQSTPLSWEKLAGTDWTLVTTNDGKKYYYDMKNKVSSWQIPTEVAEMGKNQESGVLKENPTQEENSSSITDRGSAPSIMGSPAVQTGGRESTALRPSGAPIFSSALDLIKKKLQDSGNPVASSPHPASSLPATSDINGSRTVEAVVKGQQTLNSKDKENETNEDGNISDSSSDSEDMESTPTKETCIIQFKEMLKERGVAPFSKWDKELPKIVFDPRFKAVPSYSTRRSLFEHFVRTRAEEERKEKRAAQKAAIDCFRQLLEEASKDIDHKTDYHTFKRKWGSDPRFEALDRKERELLLNEKVSTLKKTYEEKNQAVRSAAVNIFKSLLRENKDISTNSRWFKVKESLRNDPRYKSVKHEDRELLFNEYISELKDAEGETERIAKAKRDEQEKLKERERETRKRKERDEQEMERMRLKVRRKEAVASYQALLVETIKDPKASWTESKPKLEKDPQGRSTNSELSPADMEKLFRDHVKDLYERFARDFRSLLAEVITPEAIDGGKFPLGSWSEAKQLLKADPRYGKMPRKEREFLWGRYTEEMMRKQKAAGSDSKEWLDVDGRNKVATASDPSRRPSYGRR